MQLVARCTSGDHARVREEDVTGALNVVLLVRVAAKNHVEVRTDALIPALTNFGISYDPTVLHTVAPYGMRELGLGGYRSRSSMSRYPIVDYFG